MIPEKLVKNLKSRGFIPMVHPNLLSAAEAVRQLAAPGASVGIGGSVTVEESGLYSALLSDGHPVYWHWKTPEDPDTRAKALAADIYLSGTNAVTLDGVLINTDGNGNRVVGQFYGPAEVHILCGKNKITEDIASGLTRVKEVACPKNAVRLHLSTPCAVTGKCASCRGANTMCRVTTLLEGPVGGRRVYIHLIDEDCGF